MSHIKIVRLHKLETRPQMWRRYKRQMLKWKRENPNEVGKRKFHRN